MNTDQRGFFRFAYRAFVLDQALDDGGEDIFLAVKYQVERGSSLSGGVYGSSWAGDESSLCIDRRGRRDQSAFQVSPGRMGRKRLASSELVSTAAESRSAGSW